MGRQAEVLSEPKLEEMINKFTQAYDYLSQAVIPSLPLEVAVVETAATETRELGNQVTREILATQLPSHPVTQPPSNRPDKWSALMTAVKPLNHSVEAFLRSCTGELKGKMLLVKPFYPFHKERLEEPRNLKILEEAAEQVYGKGVKVKIGPAEK